MLEYLAAALARQFCGLFQGERDAALSCPKVSPSSRPGSGFWAEVISAFRSAFFRALVSLPFLRFASIRSRASGDICRFAGLASVGGGASVSLIYSGGTLKNGRWIIYINSRT